MMIKKHPTRILSLLLMMVCMAFNVGEALAYRQQEIRYRKKKSHTPYRYNYLKKSRQYGPMQEPKCIPHGNARCMTKQVPNRRYHHPHRVKTKPKPVHPYVRQWYLWQKQLMNRQGF